MTSRDRILAAVKASKPESSALPDIKIPVSHEDLVSKYSMAAAGIGAKVYELSQLSDIKKLLASSFNQSMRWVSPLPDFSDVAETDLANLDPHNFENVELTIMEAAIGVAENSALWVTEQHLGQRVLPFICQHLAILISRSKLVPTMHEAYDLIGTADYRYGVFIAGPSKTADIEQSLVLGAHGPRSLTVFILD